MLATILTTALLLAPVSGDADRRDIRACKAEDGSGQRVCIWDARHMGNGEGDSLIIRRGGTDDATYKVITHRRARVLMGDHHTN